MAPALLMRSSWRYPYTTRLPTGKPDEPDFYCRVQRQPSVRSAHAIARRSFEDYLAVLLVSRARCRYLRILILLPQTLM